MTTAVDEKHRQQESTTTPPTTPMDTTVPNSKEDKEGEKKSPVIIGTEPVPQLDGSVSYDDLTTAVRVLKAVAALNPKKNKRKKGNPNNGTTTSADNNNNNDGIERFKHPNLRLFRKALAECLELQKRSMFQGKSEEDHYDQRQLERSLKRQKMSEKDHQKKYLADTALRRGRIERLKQKQQEAKEEEMAKVQLMIPDGHVDTITTTSGKLLLENNASSDTTTQHKAETVDDPSSTTTTTITTTTTNNNNTPVMLPKLRSCYVCKARFRELHHFYDQLCPACAALNWDKRHQTANLDGRVAIVTGSRVKIGYQTCLKLLRAGAIVVATTRFPNSALATYRQEKDFRTWNHRLHVYGLDLRDVTGLEAFTRFLKIQYSDRGIDMLINNACQTIRRPRAYYIPMVEKEQTLWQEADETHKSMLFGCAEFEGVRRKLLLDQQKTSSSSSSSSLPLLESNNNAPKSSATTAIVATVPEDNSNNKIIPKETTNNEGGATTTTPFDSRGLSHSAAMSQMIILPEDVGVSDEILPPGVTDINGQQLDLRTSNSWLLKMEEVTTPEVMECMLINAIAPFVLNSRLKPLMVIPNDRPDRYIVNVSAMEGKFYRYKMPNHPHTNMAKAALNMMTRTSAEDLAKKHRIYMNSIDTGWINDENPLERANKTASNNNFQTPIDEIDAAARILDPIFTGVNHENNNSNSNSKPSNGSKKKQYGKFLKDYRESEW